MTHREAWWALGLLLAGCGGSSDGGEGGDGDADADADGDVDADGDADADGDGDGDADTDADGDGGCDGEGSAPIRATLVAAEVRVVAGAGATTASVSAALYDGPPPRFHHETMREGDCWLLEWEPTFCEDPCDTGLCVEGACVPYPSSLSAGALNVTAYGDEVSLEDQGGLYSVETVSVPDDVAGLPVEVEATGGELAAFTLAGTTPAPMDDSLDGGDLDLDDSDNQVVVTWTPAGDACDSRVHLTLNAMNHAHGTPYEAVLECDVADVGRLIVPEALIDAFPEAFHSEVCFGRDCPQSTLSRYTRTTTRVGDVEVALTVESQESFFVLHR